MKKKYAMFKNTEFVRAFVILSCLTVLGGHVSLADDAEHSGMKAIQATTKIIGGAAGANIGVDIWEETKNNREFYSRVVYFGKEIKEVGEAVKKEEHKLSLLKKDSPEYLKQLKVVEDSRKVLSTFEKLGKGFAKAREYGALGLTVASLGELAWLLVDGFSTPAVTNQKLKAEAHAIKASEAKDSLEPTFWSAM